MKTDTDSLLEALLESQRQNASAMALIAAHLGAPPRTADDAVREQGEAERNRVRPFTIVIPGVVHLPTGFVCDLELQPNDQFPQGRIFTIRNGKVPAEVKRPMLEGRAAALEAAERRALMEMHYPEAADSDDRLGEVDRSRVAEVNRHVTKEIRHQIWDSVIRPAYLALIGKPLAQVRYQLASPLPRYVVVDHDERYPHPLPPQE